MDKKIPLLTISVFALIFLTAFFLSQSVSYARPLNATDTDGTRTSEILSNIENGHEKVILKVNPFGYIAVGGWENRGLPKEASAIVEWRAYRGFGAGRIYVGYSFGGNYTEIGPFNESDNFTQTTLNIPVNIFTDFGKLKIRLRGEDLDFGPDAIAEVSMKLKVTDYGF